MSLRVGFHAEGTDVLVLRAFLARLLGLPYSDIAPRRHEAASDGWTDLIATLPAALRDFKNASCAAAIIAMDNDGDVDVRLTGGPEDYSHPRHWNHAGMRATKCRFCDLEARLADATSASPELGVAPVVITVPTEMIEAWLLIAAELDRKGDGDLDAEKLPKSALKPAFYGSQHVTEKKVRNRALPLLARLDNVAGVACHSRSFALFADQVDSARSAILGCET